MTGYESITLLCTIVTTAITVVSFVFAIRKALDKKKKKKQVEKRKPTLTVLSRRLL